MMTLHVTCLIIAVVNTCTWLSLPLSSTLCSSLSRVPRYRTFTPRWCNTEVRVAPSIGTAAWSRQSFSYHTHTHTDGGRSIIDVILTFMHMTDLNMIIPHKTHHCWNLNGQ